MCFNIKEKKDAEEKEKRGEKEQVAQIKEWVSFRR